MTHQLLDGLLLHDQLNGQSAEFVQTLWQAGPEPASSSMHSFPAAQRAASHPEPALVDEQPNGATSANVMAAATAKVTAPATARWRNAVGSAMDDETARRYA